MTGDYYPATTKYPYMYYTTGNTAGNPYPVWTVSNASVSWSSYPVTSGTWAYTNSNCQPQTIQINNTTSSWNQYIQWNDNVTYPIAFTRATYGWPTTALTIDDIKVPSAFKTRADRLRELIRKRSGPAILIGRTPAATKYDEREERARDVLRRVVGDERYRRFLAHGFVSVKARSGRVYCIYPGHQQTLVYQNGRMIERLCVVLRGQFPPTDTLITRYLMLLNDEAGFRKIANSSSGYERPARTTIEARNLLEEISRNPDLRRTG